MIRKLSAVSASVFAMAALYSGLWQWATRRNFGEELYEGYLFQYWPGDTMMQTVDWGTLNLLGLEALWFNHVQPPALDATRLLLGRAYGLWLGDNLLVSSKSLDLLFYGFYAVTFAALAAVMCFWVGWASQKWQWGAFVGIFWILYPPAIAYSTLLEGTFLSAFLTTVYFAVLFFALQRKSASLLILSLVALFLLSLTRNLFALPLLMIVIAAYVIYYARLKDKGSKITKLLFAISLLLLVAFPLKQKVLFDTWAPTTFAGDHLAQSLSLDRESCRDINPLYSLNRPVFLNAARAESKWNSASQLALNNCYEEQALIKLSQEPRQTIATFLQTVPALAEIFVRAPDTWYVADNKIAGSIPWLFTSNSSFLAVLSLLLIPIIFFIYLQLVDKKFIATLQNYGLWLFVLGMGVGAAIVFSNNSVGVEPNRFRFIFEPALLCISTISIAFVLSRQTRKRDLNRRRRSLVGSSLSGGGERG